MRTRILTVLSLAVCLSAAAAEEGRRPADLGEFNVPAGVLIKQLQSMSAAATARNLKPAPDVVLEGAEAAFIFPVVGTAGAFRTEGVIMNRRNARQNVVAYYWPIGAGASNCNLPGRTLALDPGTWYFYEDLVGAVFGQSGFGSVLVFGVDSAGNLDSNALIDGNARIWSPATGGGTASQNFPSFSVVNVPPGQQSAFGLRQGGGFRTNWGIFNYDVNARTFDVLFNGVNGSQQVPVNMPACSLVQTPVPGSNFGPMEIVFAPRDGGGLFYAYGSSVDNSSSDAWSVPARK